MTRSSTLTKENLAKLPLLLFLIWLLMTINALEVGGGQVLFSDNRLQTLLWLMWIASPPAILLAVYSFSPYLIKNLATLLLIVGFLFLAFSGVTQAVLMGACVKFTSGALFAQSTHEESSEKLSDDSTERTYKVEYGSHVLKLVREEKVVVPGFLWVKTRLKESIL